MSTPPARRASSTSKTTRSRRTTAKKSEELKPAEPQPTPEQAAAAESQARQAAVEPGALKPAEPQPTPEQAAASQTKPAEAETPPAPPKLEAAVLERAEPEPEREPEERTPGLEPAAPVVRPTAPRPVAEKKPSVVPVIAKHAVWFGGLAALGVVGVLEWPVVAAVGVGTIVAERFGRVRNTAR